MDRVVEMAPGLASTATWQPMAFGERPAALIRNALYEPLWPGQRVLVEVSTTGADIRGLELERLAGGPALRDAIARANLADEAVLDGYVVVAPLDRVVTPGAGATAQITIGEMFRQAFAGNLGRAAREAAQREPRTREPLPLNAQLAFVAVDLLWVDRQSLLDIPLGERKRLLESVVADGELVQRVVPVLAPVERWYGRWRALGVSKVAVKGMNSRYEPGGVSDDWTIAAIPR